MFRRRVSIGIAYRVRGYIWPHSGWRRATTYLAHRIGRMSGPPHSIAAGLAAGVAVSFLPLNGAHFLLAALLALATRGSIIASAIGTVAGNPWTFPVMWLAAYRLGYWMLTGGNGEAALTSAEFVRLFAAITRAALTFDFALVVERIWPVWWPMMVGSVPLAALSWAATYWPVRLLVDKYQAQRRHRRAARLADRDAIEAARAAH